MTAVWNLNILNSIFVFYFWCKVRNFTELDLCLCATEQTIVKLDAAEPYPMAAVESTLVVDIIHENSDKNCF
jgi:hypothetical protein